MGINFSEIELDTTSEYVMHENKGYCDVVIQGDVLEAGYLLSGVTEDMRKESSITCDGYAIIDPRRKFVTELLFIVKFEDGTQDEWPIKVARKADWVEAYNILESQGEDEFKKFIDEASEAFNKKDAEDMKDITCEDLRQKAFPTPESIIKDRLDAYLWWGEEYDVDEQDYYIELERSFSLKDIELGWGKEQAKHVKRAFKQYGLI